MAHEHPADEERADRAARDQRDTDVWKSATFEGNRLAQHRAFQALSFREKIQRIEQMNEVAEALRRGRAARAETQADDTKHP